MLVLDTNIVIAHLGGEQLVTDKISAWKRQNISLAISTITECEIFSYPHLSDSEELRIERFIKDTFLVFPFDTPRAKQTARLRKSAQKIKLPDATIAALAFELNASLVTRNVKDFKNIPNLSIITF